MTLQVKSNSLKLVLVFLGGWKNGCRVAIALSSNTLVGLGLEFSQDTTYGVASDGQATKLAFINPSLTFLPTCFNSKGEEKN
ncbi:hypothetical protein [Cyclobacterium jeungdonense]|uniref:Uncharacterized protein n=1 Tax=Cyclobacterium jeungdonense TaxID=708087 RepID=A0ABT8C6R2_9BACT|nr:hypothetical protein [Cyclobacterium jeungdonense]MDN3687420.1 hypothetical protein [Cyclobacterium jeungdonense]